MRCIVPFVLFKRRKSLRGNQRVFAAVNFVIAAELGRALLDAVEVFVKVAAPALALKDAARDIGAVVGHALEIGQ